MNDNRIDWESLKWTLANDELSLDWHFGQSALDGQRPGEAPVKANFFWKLGDRPCWTVRLEKAELDACIARLEAEGLPVPPEFLEASAQFASEL